MSRLKRSFFITLGAVVIGEVALGALFFYFEYQIIVPRVASFVITNSALATAEKSVADYKSSTIPTLQRNEEFLRNLEGLFYTEDRGIEFILFLEGVVNRNNLTHTITIPPTKANSVVAFRVEGSFQNIMRFLREIEHERFLAIIKDVSIQRRVGSTVSASIQMMLATP